MKPVILRLTEEKYRELEKLWVAVGLRDFEHFMHKALTLFEWYCIVLSDNHALMLCNDTVLMEIKIIFPSPPIVPVTHTYKRFKLTDANGRLQFLQRRSEFTSLKAVFWGAIYLMEWYAKRVKEGWNLCHYEDASEDAVVEFNTDKIFPALIATVAGIKS